MKHLDWKALLCAACIFASLPAQAARNWTVHEGGKLGFTASWEGIEFDGVFHKFDAAIAFDPADLAGSRFDVKVDVTSADTQSSDRDEALADAEWFDYPKYPQATFLTTAFKSIDAGHYEATGTLTIKGISKDIAFPFTWEEHDGMAHLQGDTTVQRTDFHIGDGEWAEDDTVGFKVSVHIDLKLDAKANGN
jgi:polyisoprenoid-binding protein YceI